jgi:hypothetical protein
MGYDLVIGVGIGLAALMLLLQRIHSHHHLTDVVLTIAIDPNRVQLLRGYVVRTRSVLPVTRFPFAFVPLTSVDSKSLAADEGFLPPLHVAAQASPGQHQQFVDELCQALRDSGKEAYEGITKCAVDFTYGVEQLKRLQEEAAAAAASDSGILSWPWGHKSNEGPHSGLPMAAELDLHNVGEGAEQDLGEITKAFIEAYNAVHADTPYQMESFGADRVMAAREYEEEQDDGSEALSASPHDGHRVLKRYPCYTCRWDSIYGSGRFHCTMCRDERSVLPPMETMLLQYKESRFKVMEKLFCHKIGAGGNASVRNVRGCKINLVAVSGDGTALTTTDRE